ncbi:MAG: glycosyltransferase, partial [bacterium]|nr:glycosyltransferase [bacterium]
MSATSRPAATAELPFISVVIPVKDRYDEVRQCLSALSVSAYEKKEVIVVDDGSKIPLCETDLPGKCTVIRFDRSRGPSVARNTGARAAAGTIILFLDSDCILEQDILEKIGSLSLRYPSVAAFNGIYVTPPATESISSRFAALEMNYCFLNPPSTVFTALSAIRREVFIESGGFDESLTSPFADDVLLGWKLEELGYTTMFDFDLRTLHLKQYSFFSY